MTADQAAALVPDGLAVGVTGGGGGLVEPDTLLAAIENRFLQTGSPRDLTLVHALGLGDREKRGVNRFAHESLVKRVIGGHWFGPRGCNNSRATKRSRPTFFPQVSSHSSCVKSARAAQVSSRTLD